MTLEEMDKLWNEAKALEKKANKMILLKVRFSWLKRGIYH